MPNNEKMPTLFLAHGSPMNALGGNAFSDALATMGRSLPHPPRAILVVSAHWRTNGTEVLKIDNPETIYDFGGFPDELHRITYPAPGATQLADRVMELLRIHKPSTTNAWGLDHGTWTILRHMYPAADIPVTQLGIAKRATLTGHYAMAQLLAPLREEGVLIIGSGNITHNLGAVDWGLSPRIADWALHFDQFLKDAVLARDLGFLLRATSDNSSLWAQAHPTLEHYIPLLYALGTSDNSDNETFPYEGFDMGTLSMRCIRFG